MCKILDVYNATGIAFIALVLFVPQLPYQPTRSVCLASAAVGWLIGVALVINGVRAMRRLLITWLAICGVPFGVWQASAGFFNPPMFMPTKANLSIDGMAQGETSSN